MLDDLKFILTDKVNTTGLTLSESPEGWDNNLVTFERSLKYWGIFRSFSLPLKFTKEAATAIRTEFYNYGLMAGTQIEIQKLDRSTLTYFTAYLGVLDYYTFKDTDFTVDINIVDAGFANYIKKFESVQYTIQITPDKITEFHMKYVQDFMEPPNYDIRQGVQLNVFFPLLVDALTGGMIVGETLAVKSDYLDTLVDKVILTTYDTWKRDSSDPPRYDDQFEFLKSSFEEFFKSLNTFNPIGVGIEVIGGKETLVLEERAYFLDSDHTIATSVSPTKNLAVSYINDLLFSSVKVGFRETKYKGEANSRWEPSGWVTYALKKAFVAPSTDPITYTPKIMEIISSYRADHNGIYEVSMSTDIKVKDINDNTYTIHDYNKADTEGNQDIYLTELYRFPHTDPNYPDQLWYALGSVENVDHTYPCPSDNGNQGNLYFSPRHCFYRHLAWLNDFSWQVVPGVSPKRWQAIGSSKCNQNLVTQDKYDAGGSAVHEYLSFDDDVELDIPTYVLPISVEFDTPYIRTLMEDIWAHPSGRINFIYLGHHYIGYILKMEVKFIPDQVIRFKVIMNGDTTSGLRIQNLIR